MIEALRAQLTSLRIAHTDAVLEGKTTQAAHLLKAIHKTYERLADLTYIAHHD